MFFHTYCIHRHVDYEYFSCKKGNKAKYSLCIIIFVKKFVKLNMLLTYVFDRKYNFGILGYHTLYIHKFYFSNVLIRYVFPVNFWFEMFLDTAHTCNFSCHNVQILYVQKFVIWHMIFYKMDKLFCWLDLWNLLHHDKQYYEVLKWKRKLLG